MNKIFKGIIILTFFHLPSLASEVFFSPKGGALEAIVQHINESQRTIEVAIYSLTAKPISEALVRAPKRGVKVTIVMDAQQTTNAHSEDEFLEESGIPLRRITGIGRGIMHDKFAVFDGRVIVTGSYNWTNNAENYNHENAVFLDDKSVVEKFSREFEILWQQTVKSYVKKGAAGRVHAKKRNKKEFPDWRF